jgi:hypothetical protein
LYVDDRKRPPPLAREHRNRPALRKQYAVSGLRGTQQRFRRTQYGKKQQTQYDTWNRATSQKVHIITVRL